MISRPSSLPSGIYIRQVRNGIEHEQLKRTRSSAVWSSRREEPLYYSSVLGRVTYRLLHQRDMSLSFGAILSCASSTDPDPR